MPVNPIVKKCKNDKFYTNRKVAAECFEELWPMVAKGVYIEPSAGSGSFSSLVDCIAYDIAPEAPGIMKQDWLRVDSIPSPACVFGNPPFGNRNDLAKEFIRHSIDLGADIIAFILPSVFMKSSYQKVFPKEWFLVHYHELPKDSFILKGEPYHVPCVFQIWRLGKFPKNLRASTEKRMECKDFFIVDKSEADWFTFGAAPHKTLDVEDVQPNNRGYWIKENTEGLRDKFRSIEWSKYGWSSVNGGAYWLTSTELITAYEKEAMNND